jgi:hypothetical protein
LDRGLKIGDRHCHPGRDAFCLCFSKPCVPGLD